MPAPREKHGDREDDPTVHMEQSYRIPMGIHHMLEPYSIGI